MSNGRAARRRVKKELDKRLPALLRQRMEIEAMRQQAVRDAMALEGRPGDPQPRGIYQNGRD